MNETVLIMLKHFQLVLYVLLFLNETIVSVPATVSAPTCNLGCRDDEAPVCGTDNATYRNRCQLLVEACKNPAKKLEVLSDGECLKETGVHSE